MTTDVEGYLFIGAVLFVLGALGFLTRRNLILMVLSAEMMLHGVSLTLVTFGDLHGTTEGQSFTIFILTVAACEAGLALALIISLYQKTKSLDIDVWTNLHETDLPHPARLGVGDGQTAAEIPLLSHPTLTPAGAQPQVDDGGHITQPDSIARPEPVSAGIPSRL